MASPEEGMLIPPYEAKECIEDKPEKKIHQIQQSTRAPQTFWLQYKHSKFWFFHILFKYNKL